MKIRVILILQQQQKHEPRKQYYLCMKVKKQRSRWMTGTNAKLMLNESQLFLNYCFIAATWIILY